MPRVHLTQQFTDNPPILKDKPRMDYFDTLIPGFLLEVRSTGKGTYCAFIQGLQESFQALCSEF